MGLKEVAKGLKALDSLKLPLEFRKPGKGISAIKRVSLLPKAEIDSIVV